MASRRQTPARAAVGGLSAEAAHHYARVYAAARAGCMRELRRAGCAEEEAEEIFAATLERIMRRRDPVREGFAEAQTVSLLKQACRQKLIDERRHGDVLRIVPLGEALARPDPTAQSAEEAAEAREAVAIGREAIASLPARERRLFLQRHRQGLAPEEIVRRNPGLSRRTYRKVIQRANARALAAFEEIGSGARCAQVRGERLRRYVSAEASEAEARAVDAHLRHCRACAIEVARMRGVLHEVASGALLLAAEGTGVGALGGLATRLLDAAGHGGAGLVEATRAARERLRELAIRWASGLPGSGGEGAIGQIAGASGAKAASACAAGAVAASCLAAGVVPGVGLVEPANPREQVRRPQPARSAAPPPGHVERPVAAQGAGSAAADAPRLESPARRRRSARSAPQPEAGPSARPTPSDSQTGAEFGIEADGVGVPAPGGSAPSGGASQPAGSSGEAGSAEPSAGGSQVAREFGL